MKNFNYVVEKRGVCVLNQEFIHPRDLFHCGQAFRWEEINKNHFILVALERVIEVVKEDRNLCLMNTTEEDFLNLWINYFDLDTNYEKIIKTLSKDDPVMKKATEFGKGIRILKQEPFETFITFIISSNNNIKRIKGSIEKIARGYGKTIGEYKGKKYYAFPTPQELSKATEEDLKAMGLGYRWKYVYYSSREVAEDPGILHNYRDQERKHCLQKITEYPGVGPKVGNCIVFFAMGKLDAFPVDVWVKRVMELLYFHREASINEIEDFAREKFGDLAGYAQQYLFYYAREHRLKDL